MEMRMIKFWEAMNESCVTSSESSFIFNVKLEIQKIKVDSKAISKRLRIYCGGILLLFTLSTMSLWLARSYKKRGGVCSQIFFARKKKKKERESTPNLFALFVHFAKWLLIYLVHVFNTLEKYAMKARFACNTFSTAMTYFCT